MAEAGSVEHVIGDPKHPYTQLLVSSIPLPDLSQSWGDDSFQVAETSDTRVTTGCKFAPRCPHAMDMCWTTVPPKVLPDAERMTSCLLQRDAPKPSSNDVAAAFRAPHTEEHKAIETAK